MIIRVLFLSAGAAVRDREMGQHRAASGSVVTAKRPVTEGKADVASGDRMTRWLNYFPGNSSSRSSKIRRQSLCLVCGQPIREQGPG